MRFFPFVFTIFMFVLTVNLIGLIPYSFTVTSHIIITVSLALLVFLTVVVYGFWKNGLHFFKLFVPSGIPIYILPLVVFIEVLSFLSRPGIPQRAAVRQHARRPHHAQSIRRVSSPCLAPSAFVGWLGAVLPLGLSVALTALEFLVAFLQAYVFAILTCIYLNDALHPGH